MPKRPCLECGRPIKTSRCASHDPRLAYRNGSYKQQAAAYIRRHRARYGDWCPGAADLDHPDHDSTDLTIDHIVSVSAGAQLLDETNWRVLCRGTNSSKARRP